MSTIDAALDWSVLDIDGITRILDITSRRVADKFEGGFHQKDDLFQEGAILLASRGDRVHAQADDDALGLVAHELEMDLLDLVRPEGSRRQRTVSYELTREGEE